MRDRLSANLFERLPSHFRTRDAGEGRPLEALMALFGEELQILERDIDQLYDNWFVETCEPWVLPYIAELVGARPMREIGADQKGLLRAYVGNVLQYRQAKGTAAVVEQVARDVSGWSVVAVEFFQNLATSQHVNHVRPDAPAFANVRETATARVSRGPFSRMAHSPAAGQPNGWAGRYNIPHLGLFVWRRAAAPLWPVEIPQPGYLGGPVPRADGTIAGLFRLDPLGRDIALVNRPAADTSVAARMVPRTVPAPLTRDEVAEALNAARHTGHTPGRWFEATPPFRVRLEGDELPPSKLFCCNLEATEAGEVRRPANSGEVLVDPVLGRLSVHADDESASLEVGFAHSQSFDIGGGAYDRRASLEKWLPDFAVPGEAPPWQIGVSKITGLATDNVLEGGPVVATLRAAITRWNAHATPGARGIIAVMDSGTYPETLGGATHTVKLPKGSRLAIVAANWPGEEAEGGLLSREPGALSPTGRRPYLTGTIMVDAEDAGSDEGASLVIDGLAIGGNVNMREAGDLGFLRLYNCTIGSSNGTLNRQIIADKDNARLNLTLDRCIVGRVNLPEATGRAEVTRSIIGEDRVADTGGGPAGPPALRVPQMDLAISGATVFGATRCRSIEAENAIFVGDVTVEHRQRGCVRFCYVNETAAVPRKYACVPRASDTTKPRPVFSSTRFGDPGFGQLSLSAPSVIREGAEDGMEMGIGFAERAPARVANIIDATQDFAPFGLAPGLIFLN